MSNTAKITFNLDYQGSQPNFARDTVETIAELLGFSVMDDGHITYVRNERLHYIYDSRNEPLSGQGKWRRIDESSISLYSDGVPETSALDGAYIPANGCNYNLGEIEGLGLSVEMPAMTLGCTIVFTAATDFTIVVPVEISYTDQTTGQTRTIEPVCPSRLMNRESLDCIEGQTYLMHVTTAKGDSGHQYFNVFTLSTMYVPTMESNNAVSTNEL